MEEKTVIRIVQGKQVLIDESDAPMMDRYTWHLSRKGYVKTNIPRGDFNLNSQLLARIIMSAPKGRVVDHISGDILDNRKTNLRICTNTENTRNCRKKKPSSGGFKGVYRTPYSRYQAMIRVNKKLITIGTFATAKEAALAYNEAAMLHFGEFASLNEI